MNQVPDNLEINSIEHFLISALPLEAKLGKEQEPPGHQ